MPPTFDDDMNNGFAELAEEAGTTLTFKGSAAFAAVFDDGGTERMQADMKLGSTRLVRLMVARSAVGALASAPAAGDYFDMGATRLRIEDVEDDEPTSTTIVYVVKKRGG